MCDVCASVYGKVSKRRLMRLFHAGRRTCVCVYVCDELSANGRWQWDSRIEKKAVGTYIPMGLRKARVESLIARARSNINATIYNDNNNIMARDS